MQDDPSESDSLKQCISELEAENNKIKAENVELKARVAKLEDKQSQNELIKNLLSVSRKT
jgi:cell division protein FtsB